MATIEESIEVRVAAHTAYDRWYEEFPTFMEGDSPTGDAGSDARIVDQEPGRSIRWRSQGVPAGNGSVVFEATGDDSARVRISLDQETPDGDDGLVQRRVRREIERFKDLVEARAAGDPPEGAVADREPPAVRLPSLSSLRGMAVRNDEDEKVGKVREVYLDAGADHVRYLGITTGWLSRGIHVVPIDDVSYIDDGDEPFVVVPYSVEHLKAAPSLDDGDELSAEREREIYEHYERVGYWDAARDAIRSRQATPAPTPEIAEAEAADALMSDGEVTRLRRWGV